MNDYFFFSAPQLKRHPLGSRRVARAQHSLCVSLLLRIVKEVADREIVGMTRMFAGAASALIVLVLAACATEPFAVNGTASHNFRVSRGQDLDITLSTVGPGQYDSLPVISFPALRFIDMAFVGPYTPGGPNQRYRFHAESPGRVTILFRRSDSRSAVVDTVEVQ